MARKIPAPKPCESCGETFTVFAWQLAKGWGRFCSVGCGSKSRTGSKNGNWKGDSVAYEAVHFRLLAQRGSATLFKCLCGEQASEWAYSHKDPDPLLCPKGRPYSTDLDQYTPMCIPCHRKLDNAGQDAV